MIRGCAVTIAAACLAATCPAGATVIGFDDLTDSVTFLPTGYAGVDWGDDFWYYDFDQATYTPSSPFTRIFANPQLHPLDQVGTLTFSFADPVSFLGFYTAGNGAGTTSYDLYLDGAKVGSSISVLTSPTPTFVTNSYAGLADEVRISAVNGRAVFDDITFDQTEIPPVVPPPEPPPAVPEPSTWLMMAIGIGAVGAALRRRSGAPVLA